MAQQATNSNLTMDADDHQMYKTGSNLAMVKGSLEEQGKQAMSWCEENYLQANSDKFQVLTINPRNVDTSPRADGAKRRAMVLIPHPTPPPRLFTPGETKALAKSTVHQ